jgi:galactokinase
VCGADVLVDSAVPVGAGLSSSAALECSVGLAVAELAGATPEPDVLALAGQRAETSTVGAPVGVMDLMASVHGSDRGALLLDCRSLDHRFVPLPLQAHGLVVVAIDTRVTHAHAHGGYGERRAQCEQAAESLGVASLRDASQADLERLDGVLLRRARHVVTENARVLETAAALEADDLARVGELFAASHRSLREDFEVSCPELDIAVDAAMGAGAVAARMTGGGFGGSVVAFVPGDSVADVEAACAAAATETGAPIPVVRVVAPATGACRCG